MPIFQLTDKEIFPPPQLANAEGILAVGGDLSPKRLLKAYTKGIFPWYGPGDPILWWSPDPRMVLFPERLHVSRSLRKTIRRGQYRVSFDTAFKQVIRACSRQPRKDPGTWIVPQMIEAFDNLHRLGLAHSMEIWVDDQLSGGLYGVALGRCFFGESMFSKRRDMSKIALYHLSGWLIGHGFGLIDCQVKNDHLQSLGAELISRVTFQKILEKLMARKSLVGKWRFNSRFDSLMETIRS